MSYQFKTYQKKEISLEYGKGVYLYDQRGKRYFDFMAGIAVCNFGHNHQSTLNALIDQAKLLWHSSNLFRYDIQDKVAKKLVDISVCDHVFFCNSGTEANEAAIKLARRATNKNHIVSMKQSFHGRTTRSMAATGQSKVQEGYGPLLPSFSYATFNDSSSLEKSIQDDTAAIMIEVVQGEGGVHLITQEFVETINKLCHERSLLLIIDEVQTGMGRTGKMFAYEHYNLSPDIVTLAKGLGNGFPVGAMLGKGYLNDSFDIGSHGTTYGGNPLAMSVVNSVLKELAKEELLEKVLEKSNKWMIELEEKLIGISIVKEVRYKGLLIGIETFIPCNDIINKCEENGLLLISAGINVIRLLPPIIINEIEWREATSILLKVLYSFEKSSMV